MRRRRVAALSLAVEALGVAGVGPEIVMVPKGGLEPPRGNPHYALNVARLPVPPLRQRPFL